jgi:hypothetical protein
MHLHDKCRTLHLCMTQRARPPHAVTARVMAAMSCSTSGSRACWPAEASSIRAAAIRLLCLAECGICRSSHTLQVVVLNGAALPHSCTLGYSEQDYDQLPLLSIDGRSIRNLVDVALALERAQGPLVTFMFANEREIVLSLPEGQAATVELMRDFGIPAPWSPDVAAGLCCAFVRV